ncbi:MAG: hypothetical protein ACLP9L_04070 [Thermoguttaceae bacterium]
MRRFYPLLPLWLGLALAACGGWACRGAEPNPAVDPLVYVFDAPEAPISPLPARGPAKPQGSTLLEEDDRRHRFAGCPVLMNDKIVAVLHKDVPAVDVYSRQPSDVKLCATLQPICDGSSELQSVSVRIVENGRSTAAIEVEFRTPGKQARRITYELSAGAAFVKTTAGEGIERLRVKAPCRFAILPDFFGDDILVDAAAIPTGRAELPSENFLLHMIPGGNTIVMTVSESRENDVAVALSDRGPRQIVASDVSFGKKLRIWVAVLTGRGIWHEHRVALSDADQTIGLEWKMPFPALWRVDWSTVDKMTESWEMLLQQPDGKYVMQGWFGQNEAEGQSFGKEFGPRDWNKPGRKRWNPVLGEFSFPNWIQSDGRGYLQPLKARRYTEGGPVYNFAGPVVIYPLDRVKAAPFSTPLDQLTVVDLVRMTLGVGPCQYILDLEGQKRNSRGVCTCYARDTINAIYKEGTQRQKRAEIEEQLDAAVAFISNVRQRIDLYVQFGHEMSVYLERQKRHEPRSAAFCDELLALTKRLDQVFAEKRRAIRSPAFARQCAEDFRRNLLTSTGEDSYPRCEAQMAVFTSIGGAQDGLVASCRMIVKTLRQRAGIALAVNPELKDVATEVRTHTQAILRNPTPYEAPRH